MRIKPVQPTAATAALQRERGGGYWPRRLTAGAFDLWRTGGKKW